MINNEGIQKQSGPERAEPPACACKTLIADLIHVIALPLKADMSVLQMVAPFRFLVVLSHQLSAVALLLLSKNGASSTLVPAADFCCLGSAVCPYHSPAIDILCPL